MTGGGGGAVSALCPQKEEAVTSAPKTAGYETLTPFIDPNTQNNKLPKSEHSITLTKKTDERLIVVNENDDVLDFLPRSQCHAGEGILPRAFSIHIFNDRNQILLQQRSEHKQLWPFHWSPVAVVIHESVKQPLTLLKDVCAKSWRFRCRCNISTTLSIRPDLVTKAPKL
jgi:hypothetical protein